VRHAPGPGHRAALSHAAFEHFGGAPIVYHPKLTALGVHYGFTPLACQRHRAKTKVKVERPYRDIRADLLMARRFANLEYMNRLLRLWLNTVANARLHGNPGREVDTDI
jgi:transposase